MPSNAHEADDDFLNPLCKRNLREGVLQTMSWDNVTIVCIDIVSFTHHSSTMPSAQICTLLQSFFDRIDRLSVTFQVDKIDIIGDAYVAVSQSTNNAVAFCLAALALAKATYWDEANPSKGFLHLRCAVHTGKVTGLVLDSVPFKYTLVGETMNKAKKLETLSPPNHVNCSAAAASYLDTQRFQQVRHDSDSFLVYPVDQMEQTILNVHTHRFLRISDKFVTLFGFERAELRSMRVLLGPKTRLEAIQIAMEQCLEFKTTTTIPVFLYTRDASALRVALEFSKPEDDEGCVLLRCVLLVTPS